VSIDEARLFLGRSAEPEYLALKFANRHGLITGATGTGKMVSLQVLAEPDHLHNNTNSLGCSCLSR
jgi:hypothetical protein